MDEEKMNSMERNDNELLKLVLKGLARKASHYPIFQTTGLQIEHLTQGEDKIKASITQPKQHFEK